VDSGQQLKGVEEKMAAGERGNPRCRSIVAHVPSTGRRDAARVLFRFTSTTEITEATEATEATEKKSPMFCSAYSVCSVVRR